MTEMHTIFFGIKKERDHFYHIYNSVRAYCVICGLDEEVSKIEVTISDKEDAYWAWEANGQLSMIFPAEFLFNMCFPVGYKEAQRKGWGKAVRVDVKEIESKTRRQWEQEL